uniref:Uncharacterized protein n=1 Tax=Zea mays TaxID=4577 RepID=C4J1E1_MAIZE|nr:unknown [Zea mays]
MSESGKTLLDWPAGILAS